MNRLRVVLFAGTLIASTSVLAAEVTRVASSFDEDDPFDLYIDVGFERTQRRMLISQEAPGAEGEIEYHKELRYTGVDTRLNFDLHVGLWQDFEFTFGIPFVFAHSETWNFAAGTDQSNSTLFNNCLQANGLLTDPGCPTTGAGARSIVAFNTADGYEVIRGGLGNMRFGLRYAFFNQKRDDTKPMWVVGIDYEAPTAEKLDPTVETSRDLPGRIGDRNHKYTLWTAFSRRMGIAEPYFKAYYTLPYRGPGWYSNCEHPDPARMSYPENCNTEAFSRSLTGIRLPHRSGMSFGSEFVIFNQPQKSQRIALDVRAVADYVGNGRYYNEASGLLKKLLWTGDYLKFGGALGIEALASDYVSVRATAKLLYNTEHYLTDEWMGKDVDGDGTVEPGNGAENGGPEVNPNFDFRVDSSGRRLRAQEINEFRIDLVATFAF